MSGCAFCGVAAEFGADVEGRWTRACAAHVERLQRQALGRWELPDGGEVDVYLDGNRITCEWPSLPLSRANRRYYLRHIGPVVIQRAKAALGIDGAALWVQV